MICFIAQLPLHIDITIDYSLSDNRRDAVVKIREDISHPDNKIIANSDMDAFRIIS